MIRRNGLRALRSAGPDGKRLLHDIDVFVAGTQRAAARGEEQRRSPSLASTCSRPMRWSGRSSARAAAAKGGAGSSSARCASASAPARRSGCSTTSPSTSTPTPRRRMTRTTPVRARAAQPERQRDPRRRQPAAHADRRRDAQARPRRTTPNWASNFQIIGRKRSHDGAPAVRRRPADRLLLPRPHARGRRALARPPGARRYSPANPGAILIGRGRGLRVEPDLRRLRPHRRVRRGRCAAARAPATATRAAAAAWARSTPA